MVGVEEDTDDGGLSSLPVTEQVADFLVTGKEDGVSLGNQKGVNL